MYVVDRVKPEPLLGEEHAEELGIISFHLEEKDETAISKVTKSMVPKLGKVGTKLQIKKPTPRAIEET